MDIKELEREAEEARKRADKATAALAAALEQQAEERLAPLRALVVRAHNCLCQWNHTDGCSWGYEESAPDPWRCDAHHRWLNHYDRLLNGSRYEKPVATLEEIETIIGTVETLKPKVRAALQLLRGKLTP